MTILGVNTMWWSRLEAVFLYLNQLVPHMLTPGLICTSVSVLKGNSLKWKRLSVNVAIVWGNVCWQLWWIVSNVLVFPTTLIVLFFLSSHTIILIHTYQQNVCITSKNSRKCCFLYLNSFLSVRYACNFLLQSEHCVSFFSSVIFIVWYSTTHTSEDKVWRQLHSSKAHFSTFKSPFIPISSSILWCCQTPIFN